MRILPLGLMLLASTASAHATGHIKAPAQAAGAAHPATTPQQYRQLLDAPAPVLQYDAITPGICAPAPGESGLTRACEVNGAAMRLASLDASAPDRANPLRLMRRDANEVFVDLRKASVTAAFRF